MEASDTSSPVREIQRSGFCEKEVMPTSASSIRLA